MQLPYLTGPLRETFDAWLEGTIARYIPPLTFTELRKGVQALSWLYVERRSEGALATRAIDGQGKRGGFATYYAALHFLTVHHAAEMIDAPTTLGTIQRVIDLGCGTGAVGSALATTLTSRPELIGIDRSGWALEETERTWAAFGLQGRPIREELPAGLPTCGPGDLISLGWTLSELDDDSRNELLRRLFKLLRKGAAIFITEPLSTKVTPWWTDWAEQLAPYGVRDELCKVAIDRPFFIADMDKAARLDHQVIGGRVLAGRIALRPK